MTKIDTPYYIIYEDRLLKNLKKIQMVRHESGAKCLLALKCFSSWAVFDIMRKYMDGTTSSSVYEVRLGYEEFGKETHAYCVGYKKNDIKEVKDISDKIIFNSVSQLKRYYKEVRNKKIGLRVNPQISYSHFDLADPARQYSRLGVINIKELNSVLPLISGVMFHFNCENDDFNNFSKSLDYIGEKYEKILNKIEWVSLGGGIYFTKDNYPIKEFCNKIREFGKYFNVQIYLEPGESAITRSAELVTTVVDIVHNKIDIAIVDASTEAHMLDLLIYQTPAKMDVNNGKYLYQIAGRSCLAGDIFGTYRFCKPLKIGNKIRIADAAGYSIVKKNWFNGLQMPSIVVKKIDGKIKLIRKFYYNDFKNSLS
jgi:carboxynorspermidine decarboxylase